MPFMRSTRSLLVIVFVLSILVSGALAQITDDPLDKPRKTEKEIARIYEDWLSKDVKYIITSEEKKAFKALKTDEERENFIESFWRRRDPNPDTEENEYREEYYERIAYSNEHFTSGKPGWMTDRGRIYITWGKPDSVESRPMGGAYDRPAWEGGGTTTTYPFEIWFYRYLEGVGSGIEIEFVDPSGTGEYRIARNANEKDALLFVPGAGLTTNEMLGISSKSDRIAGTNQRDYYREQDSPFRRIELISNLQRPPQVKFADLQTTLDQTPVIDNNPLDFDLRVDFFKQTDDRVITTFTIQTENKELVFEDIGGIPTARMNIFGRITAVTDRRAGIFEDSVIATSSAADLAEEKERKSVYQNAQPLAPGNYKVQVVVRDVASGNKGIQSIGFKVPKFDKENLWTSTLILASKLRPTDDRDIGAMFVIGNAKVIPNLSADFQKGQDVGIYLQVYNAKIDQTTLRPAVDVEYILSKDGKEIFREPENWSGLSDSGQRLTLARLLPTSTLEPGEYEIKIRIQDKVGTEVRTLTPSEKFRIVE
ncbi:MAG: GWxTD domain-containing protein [Acidobacteria bacterium]|nr:MAG: GWxTD domain-containing protein [Acidobacteriota bacterium]REJ98395.1 MAG: GWxTD domain-containing protein [Acidobacteriota bacterium]REK17139.1 MAG: GWxTD domain-containing protein [Acidobacteriota bacterium]REK43049.1 MAG: GWxTD domain-containing protein [Acidobacteriota bacterium]